MEFQFRAEVRFDGVDSLNGISFSEFLPLPDGEPAVPLGDTEFRVSVTIDPKSHRGWVSDIDFSDIGRHHGINCTGVFLNLWADVDAETADAISTGVVNERTATFGQRVLKAIHIVHDSLVDFARNENQQTQISPRHDVDGSLQQQLIIYDTRWRCSEGWRLLKVGLHEIQFTAEMSEAINSDVWRRFRQGLQRGKFRVRPHRRLLANAFSHHERHDSRAAIIEGVAAWEMIMGGEAPRRLAEAHVNYDEREWKNLIEKAGLRASTRLFFTLAQHVPELSKQREAIIEALDLRNTVIHAGRQRIDHSRVKELLQSMRAACFACEDRDESPVDGSICS